MAPRIRALISDLREQWKALDGRIKGFKAEFAMAVRNEASTRRLPSIPGIGTLKATAHLGQRLARKAGYVRADCSG